MFIQILFAIVIGLLIGTITGLVPGLHINLIAIFLISISSYLFKFITPVSVIIFIISMSITHTFVDAIPSIYLGAPDESQALGVLPGHRMLLQGEGHNAIKLTLIGSFLSVVFGVLFFPFFIKSINIIYPLIKNNIAYILIFLLFFIISKEKTIKNKLKATLILLLSGSLGISVFYLSSLGFIQQPLLPMLSGLFGLSILLVSINQNTKIPKQEVDKKLNLKKGTLKKTTISSLFVGFVAAFLPGFGTSQAAILAKELVGELNEKGFLILIGGLNTANMLLSLSTFFVLEKARNGSIIAIKEIIGKIDIPFLMLILISLLITAGFSVFVTLKISKKFSSFITKANYKTIVSIVSLFIILMCFLFSGIFGLFILFISISLGIFCHCFGIGKNYLTGCLIIPVILNFLL